MKMKSEYGSLFRQTFALQNHLSLFEQTKLFNFVCLKFLLILNCVGKPSTMLL